MNWPVILKAVVPLGSILLAAVILVVIEALFKATWAQKGLVAFFAQVHAVLRWFLVLTIFAILSFVIRPLGDLVSTQFESVAPAGAPAIASTAPANRANASSPAPTPRPSKDSVDELKWMLTVLAGFAVVISIAQAATAWVSALTYDKQASSKLQDLDETMKKRSGEVLVKLEEYDATAKKHNRRSQARLNKIGEVLKGVRARYPMFYEVEKKRNLAHDRLIEALRKVFAVSEDSTDPTEAINYMKDFYHELDIETRLLVLSVESFASIDLHPPSKGSEVANLKLFAVFYHAKYRYEKILKGSVSLDDLERARGYLMLALKKAERDFTLHNELGNVYTTLGESIVKEIPAGYPNFLGDAKKSFKDSLALEDGQQRARYNLAYILARHEKQYDEAVKLLRTAKLQPKWQNAPAPPDLAAYLDYNLGCSLAQSLASRAAGRQLSKDEDEVKEAISFLAAGLQTGKILRKDVDGDYAEHGDIWTLLSVADDPLKAELQRIRPL